MATYGLIADLAAEVDVPAGGILSRTVHDEGGVTLVVFAFDAGQSLSEHTSARPAIVEVLEGEAEVVLAGDANPARPGTWISMPARMPHAIHARTPMKMALTLLPAGPAEG